MVDEENGEKSDGDSASDENKVVDSDEEIPDEKPEGDGGAGNTTMIGDETALENELIAQINQLQSEEQELDENVKQKETLLERIKQQQKEMQDVLLKEMREEYHKKIATMVHEIQRLESQKTDSLSKSTGNAQKSKVEDQFKKKEAELKIKLKELQQKQQEQTRLTKALNQQKLKTQ